jgi:hypothetical protein
MCRVFPYIIAIFLSLSCLARGSRGNTKWKIQSKLSSKAAVLTEGNLSMKAVVLIDDDSILLLIIGLTPYCAAGHPYARSTDASATCARIDRIF